MVSNLLCKQLPQIEMKSSLSRENETEKKLNNKQINIHLKKTHVNFITEYASPPPRFPLGGGCIALEHTLYKIHL